MTYLDDLSAEIEDSIADYSRIFPVPCGLAPNLTLASLALAEARRLESEVAKADLAGFNRGYAQADREWQLAGDGKGYV